MLNDYIDVGAVFESLASLPAEIAAARRGVFSAQGADETRRAETELANLETEFRAIRYTIKLAQIVGALQFADAVDLAAKLQQEAEEMHDDEIPF